MSAPLAAVVDQLCDRLRRYGDLLDDPATPPALAAKLVAALDKRSAVLAAAGGVANTVELFEAEVAALDAELARIFAN